MFMHISDRWRRTLLSFLGAIAFRPVRPQLRLLAISSLRLPLPAPLRTRLHLRAKSVQKASRRASRAQRALLRADTRVRESVTHLLGFSAPSILRSAFSAYKAPPFTVPGLVSPDDHPLRDFNRLRPLHVHRLPPQLFPISGFRSPSPGLPRVRSWDVLFRIFPLIWAMSSPSRYILFI
jgi:hypothetical protein